MQCASRRAMLAAGAGAVGALAGCQVYGGESDQPPPAAPAASGGTEVATVDQVPVGGGFISGEHQVVITQPVAGDYRAFSAICTHQGCVVNEVTEGTINCDCHGSKFSIEDGSVVQAASGLSPEDMPGLPEAAIAVNGNSIQFP
jgi:Rieske Fe-S protein